MAAACLLSAITLTGCTNNAVFSAAELAKRSRFRSKFSITRRETMEAGDYMKAALRFDDVDRQYPYSQWATRAC